jgi:hypothetical protein
MNSSHFKGMVPLQQCVKSVELITSALSMVKLFYCVCHLPTLFLSKEIFKAASEGSKTAFFWCVIWLNSILLQACTGKSHPYNYLYFFQKKMTSGVYLSCQPGIKSGEAMPWAGVKKLEMGETGGIAEKLNWFCSFARHIYNSTTIRA